MNPNIKKRLLIAGIALLTVPSALLAQEDKDKAKAEKKEKKDVQSIVITRTGDVNGKTVIEINGDKVLINGKEAKDNDDVHVNVNTIKGANAYRYNMNNGRVWSIGSDDDQASLFSEDANRAMLGVVTEGNDEGAEIESITKESAAEKAGLKKGDVITKIADRKIESTDDVTETIRSHKPGDKVDITYLRDGKEQKATAELGKWKGIKMNAVRAPRLESLGGNWGATTTPEPFVWNGSAYYPGGRPRLGLSIQDTDDGVGVKVLDVDDDSNAAKAGLKEDDVIVGIDDKDIKSTDDVTRIMREAGKDKYTFNFRVKRDGKVQNMEVKMPRKLKTTDL